MAPNRSRLASPTVVIALVLAAALAASPEARAQDPRLAAAQKEGKVVWYTSLALPSSEKVAKLFEAAYPGVKVEVQRTGSQRILQRVMQELAGQHQERRRGPHLGCRATTSCSRTRSSS